MSQEFDEMAQKIHNPQAEFDKPSDVVKDPELSQAEKKKALENLEQDVRLTSTRDVPTLSDSPGLFPTQGGHARSNL